MIEKLTGDLSPDRFNSLSQLIDYVCAEHADLPAFTCFSRTLTYAEIDELSNRFAHYLITQTALKPGDRIAIQLPNILQFPVAFYGAVRAGLVVVNTNPLYTATEMAHQFKNSGVEAIVILSNFCDKLEQIVADTNIKTVIVTQLGDLQKPLKRRLINFLAKYVKKMVPNYSLAGAIDFQHMMNINTPKVEQVEAGSGDDVALILYTGGTTGVAKGAMLSHNNLIANMMQLRSRCLKIIEDKIDKMFMDKKLNNDDVALLSTKIRNRRDDVKEQSAAPAVPVIATQNTRKCLTCGSAMASSQQYCPNCGH